MDDKGIRIRISVGEPRSRPFLAGAALCDSGSGPCTVDKSKMCKLLTFYVGV